MTPTPYATLFERHRATKTHYQPQLATFLRPYDPHIIVETGSGISTLYLLHLLDDFGGDRRLYSIDPSPLCGFEVSHPRYELIRAKSEDALAPLAARTPPWDVFLHDSDHSHACMDMEFEFALKHVRPGGWIWTDDFDWGIPPHKAWHDFLTRHHLSEVEAGAARGTQIP